MRLRVLSYCAIDSSDDMQYISRRISRSARRRSQAPSAAGRGSPRRASRGRPLRRSRRSSGAPPTPSCCASRSSPSRRRGRAHRARRRGAAASLRATRHHRRGRYTRASSPCIAGPAPGAALPVCPSRMSRLRSERPGRGRRSERAARDVSRRCRSAAARAVRGTVPRRLGSAARI